MIRKYLPWVLLAMLLCAGIGGTIRIHYPYLIFFDEDHSPTTVGQILYDNNVSGWDDGSFAYYDDDEIKYLLSTDQIPTDSEDDYVWAYDKDTDTNYLKEIVGGGDMLKSTYDVSGDGYVDGNDVAYSASWNGDVNAPSMNAVYDKIETLSAGGDNVSIDSVAVTDPDFQSTGDIDFIDTSNVVTANINADKINQTHLDEDSAPTDGDFLTYDSTGTNFDWVTPNAGTDITADLEEEVTEGSLADSTIVSADIKDGEIVNADINSSAAIDISKTALVAGNALTLSTNTLNFDGGATPGGELGGTWASPTIDDDLSVSGWTIASPTFTTAFTATDLIDSDDYAAGSIDYEHLSTDVITGAAAVGTFESGDTFLVMEAGVGLREADFDDLPGAAGGDSISIDSVEVVDPDFQSGGDIDFIDTSNVVTANLNTTVVDFAHLNNNAITGATEDSGFTSGDFLLYSDTADSGNLKKVDYDDLPGGGSATAWDDIGDPDNSGLKTITFDNGEWTRLTCNTDSAGSFFELQNTDDDHTAGIFYLLDLNYSADNGDAEAKFIKFQDYGGIKGYIGANAEINVNGNITSAGTVEGATITEGGVGVPNVNDNLSVFAATTSAQLYGVLSDETGSGAGSPLAVFNQAPTIDSPTITTAFTATDLITNAHFTHLTDWGDLSTNVTGNVLIDDDVINTSNFTHSTDWGDVETDGSGNVLIDADASFTMTGGWDFGGADLEIPQASPGAPDADGEIEFDFTDGSLVIQHGSAHAELSSATDVVVGKLIKSFSATIFAPDQVNDVIPLKPIVSGEFPHGIVVTEVHMVVGTDSNYTIDVENWDDFDTINGSNPSINSTAYTSGNDGEVTDSTITYSTIAAGQIIMLDIPATDIDWVNITVFYYEPIS